jgi:Bacterial alpha-L-rhamnosidase 6 hairpin glycosidase domain
MLTVKLVLVMATLLGKETDKQYYSRLASSWVPQFNAAFFNPENATYGTGSQTEQVGIFCSSDHLFLIIFFRDNRVLPFSWTLLMRTKPLMHSLIY